MDSLVRTSIPTTEFASNYRYYLINVTFFLDTKTKTPWIVSKMKEKIEFITSKHSSEILFDLRNPNVNN